MAKDYEVKVNGEQFYSRTQTLTAEALLILAKDKKAIPGEPKDYKLKGDKGEYEDQDVIDLLEDNIFLSVPRQPTPVA